MFSEEGPLGLAVAPKPFFITLSHTGAAGSWVGRGVMSLHPEHRCSAFQPEGATEDNHGFLTGHAPRHRCPTLSHSTVLPATASSSAGVEGQQWGCECRGGGNGAMSVVGVWLFPPHLCSLCRGEFCEGCRTSHLSGRMLTKGLGDTASQPLLPTPAPQV